MDTQIKKKIVATHKYKGTEYIFAELTESGIFYKVSTEKAWPQTWLIHKSLVLLKS